MLWVFPRFFLQNEGKHSNGQRQDQQRTHLREASHKDYRHGVNESTKHEGELVCHCGIVRLVKLKTLEKCLDTSIDINLVLNLQA